VPCPAPSPCCRACCSSNVTLVKNMRWCVMHCPVCHAMLCPLPPPPPHHAAMPAPAALKVSGTICVAQSRAMCCAISKLLCCAPTCYLTMLQRLFQQCCRVHLPQPFTCDVQPHTGSLLEETGGQHMLRYLGTCAAAAGIRRVQQRNVAGK
jgi:hypothetical protein